MGARSAEEMDVEGNILTWVQEGHFKGKLCMLSGF